MDKPLSYYYLFALAGVAGAVGVCLGYMCLPIGNETIFDPNTRAIIDRAKSFDPSLAGAAIFAFVGSGMAACGATVVRLLAEIKEGNEVGRQYLRQIRQQS